MIYIAFSLIITVIITVWLISGLFAALLLCLAAFGAALFISFKIFLHICRFLIHKPRPKT